MKIRIKRDELYPVYDINGEQLDDEIEVSSEQLARWTEASRNWHAMQLEMDAVYEDRMQPIICTAINMKGNIHAAR